MVEFVALLLVEFVALLLDVCFGHGGLICRKKCEDDHRNHDQGDREGEGDSGMWACASAETHTFEGMIDNENAWKGMDDGLEIHPAEAIGHGGSVIGGAQIPARRGPGCIVPEECGRRRLRLRESKIQ